jgi:hypothetical protein
LWNLIEIKPGLLKETPAFVSAVIFETKAQAIREAFVILSFFD